jgi:psiF repeat
MKLSILAGVLALGMLAVSPVLADDAATTAPMKPAATATSKSDAAAKTAKSQECSKEADAKGLHGKPRKEFREKCKKGDM